MKYFSGITWGAADHVAACQAWIDHDFPESYALNFARAGRIRHATNGSVLTTFSAPVAWWTFPGPRFTYGAFPDEPWDHYYVSFRGPRAERMIAEGLFSRTLPAIVPIQKPEAFRAAFEALVSSLRAKPRENPRAVCLLEDMLLQVQESSAPAPVSPPLVAGVQALMHRLRETPGQCRLSEEAKRLSVSEVHLRRVFRAVTGLPPHQFKIRAALDTAALLLQTSALPVKQVADRVGYEDVYHFSKLFRKRFGIPPGAYRREMQPRPGELPP